MPKDNRESTREARRQCVVSRDKDSCDENLFTREQSEVVDAELR